MKLVFVDSDVFVRDLRYTRDVRTKANKAFLQRLREKEIRGATSIFNLLEICGVLSFNLSEVSLIGLYSNFCDRYKIQLLFPSDSEGNLQYDIPRIFEQIQNKQALGDAQISYVVERFADQLTHFISWDAGHFKGKLPIPAVTPEETF